MVARNDSVSVRTRIAALCAGLLVPFPAAAIDFGEQFDPYVVADIEVSAIAADAVDAKKQALDEAMTLSSRKVLKRVSATTPPPEVSAAEAETLISSFENSMESIGTTGYSAVVTVSYSPILVRGYLARKGIGVVDQPAPTVLLIPVVVEDGAERWWDEAADWANALSAIDMADRLTPVRFPANTAQDKAARRELLKSGDYITLGQFRVRYRAHSALIVRLDRVSGEDGMLLGLSGEDAGGPIDLTVEIPAGGIEAAAARVSDILAERWKKVAMGQGTTGLAIGNSLPVRALLTHGPDDWETLKARLERSGAVSGLAVEAMGSSEANVIIWFTGGLADLPDRLGREGLDLFEAGGAWLLQTY